MKPARIFVILILLSPYLVGFRPAGDDSASTSFRFGAGGGSYAEVSRDCSGNVVSVQDIPYSEVAVGVDHYTPVFHAGLTVGSAPARPLNDLFDILYTGDYYYSLPPTAGRFDFARPVVGFNTKYIALDLGVLVPFAGDLYEMSVVGPVGTLRIGESEGVFFRMNFLNDFPVMSGGPGLLNWGIGFPFGDPRYKMFCGMGGLGYDGLMFGAQFEFPVSRAFSIELGGSVGGSETTEYGLSAKTKVVF